MFEEKKLSPKQIKAIFDLINLSKDDSKNNEDILSFFEQFNNELLKE
jgi:hypothetical protein